ncbi:hypothetical protein [Actinomycetospora termitidis]|uniref:Uncharacterized protein n=1 Tax=Actinomycetospora termitidis TaxID=3053470 RepID=A0ABT7MBG6_9PSEU|nr:hypothetical protein [Actinomycetospora sp. Odt1-22]MDL5157514.1 hypothetical protein [Actinomycetospora sp. Odt1-22]
MTTTTRDRLLLAAALALEVLALLGLVTAVLTGPEPRTLLPAVLGVVIASVLTGLVVIGMVRRRITAAFSHVMSRAVVPGGWAYGGAPGYGGPPGHVPSDAHAHHASRSHHHDSGGWHDAGWWSDGGSSGSDWSSCSSSDSGSSGSDSGSSSSCD